MTQTPVPPKNKIRYPKGRMLQVRDCTVAICNNNNPASVLLSTFLFWHDNPRNGDTYQEDEGTFTICRTQADIEEMACHQIDVKTIHDTAVPFLQLFGYLTVKEKMNGNLYTIHINRVLIAFAAYERGAKELKAYLKTLLQLESAPIRIPEDELEETLINKSRLYLQLKPVLIATREDSNCKRGRKPKPEAAASDIFGGTETIRESRENSNREIVGANAPQAHTPLSSDELNCSPIVTEATRNEEEHEHHEYHRTDDHRDSIPRLHGNSHHDAQSEVGHEHHPSQSHSHNGANPTGTAPIGLKQEGKTHGQTYSGDPVARVSEHPRGIPAIQISAFQEPQVTAPEGGVLASTSSQRATSTKTQQNGKSKKISVDHLTLQENIFWELWCDVWFNKDIPPKLNETAYQHVQGLAPHITTKEDLDSLAKFARDDLSMNQGVKRKSIFLGNLVNCYSRWKQFQVPADDPHEEEINEIEKAQRESFLARKAAQQGGVSYATA